MSTTWANRTSVNLMLLSFQQAEDARRQLQENLKSERMRAGFGLREFAFCIGMKPSNYSTIESLDRKASPEFLAMAYEQINAELDRMCKPCES